MGGKVGLRAIKNPGRCPGFTCRRRIVFYVKGCKPIPQPFRRVFVIQSSPSIMAALCSCSQSPRTSPAIFFPEIPSTSDSSRIVFVSTTSSLTVTVLLLCVLDCFIDPPVKVPCNKPEKTPRSRYSGALPYLRLSFSQIFDCLSRPFYTYFSIL